MKICDATKDICLNCNKIPPTTNKYSHGDICRKTVQNIMINLSDGGTYTFKDGRLYECLVYSDGIWEMVDCEV